LSADTRGGIVLKVEVDGAVGVVTLDRPEARNALSGELVAAIDGAVSDLDQRNDIAAIVLTGTDPAFCAGFDLRQLAGELRATEAQQRASGVEHPGLLPAHETPMIAAVNGPAVTGGLELALSCDFLIASERARFADTHARVGAMPGGGLTIRLPELIGIDRALQMSYTGDFIDAGRAFEWGLVNEVVPHERLVDRAKEIARAMATIPPENIREIRRMYALIAAAPGGRDGEEAWRLERRLSRAWMAERFDDRRLAAERQSIVERGRRQV
jgi:enoyl-CoA hydratase